MDEGSVSIVIPAFDGNAQDVISELKGQSINCTDYVVIKGTAPAARARNLGAKKMRGKYLIFIDDDTKFNSPKVLEDVIKTLKSRGDQDAVTITWQLTPHSNWLQRRLWKDPLFTFSRNGQDAQISWKECDAACFAIRSDWFDALGGYDEELTSGEDCDLGYRITKKGGKIHTLPYYWTEHNPPRTIGGSIKKTFWYEKGNAQMARKNPEANYRINLDHPWKAVLYIFLRTVAFLPLVFLKVNYRQRWPSFSFRPIKSFFSYMGAWAYTREWLFPSNMQKTRVNTVRMASKTKR
ncbi:MAG: glycosyltransferase [Candidatus Omnitrophica bacterium]|nr:glycosyltransferase [Candidatus Omnitrophota bacterium]